MEELKALSKSPARISDISVLADALCTLQRLEDEHGCEYVFREIQQSMIGGTCIPFPKDTKICYCPDAILRGTYDKGYFVDRIARLKEDFS